MPPKKRKTRRTKPGPSPVDIHVGRRLRLRRCALGISQQYLADQCQITFQQIQKYELGTNRIAAGRLYDLGQLLGVPVGYFFEEMNAPKKLPAIKTNSAEDRKMIEFIGAYSKIDSPKIKADLRRLVKTLSAL